MEIIIHGDKDKMLEYLVELINTAKKIHPDIWNSLKFKIDGVALNTGTAVYDTNILPNPIIGGHGVLNYNTIPCTTTKTGPVKEKTRSGRSIDNIPLSSKSLKLCGTNYSSNIKRLCEKCFKDDLDGCGEQNCKYLVPVRIEKAVDEYIPIHPVLDCKDKPGDRLCGDLHGKIDDTVRLCPQCLKDWNIYGCGKKGGLHLYYI